MRARLESYENEFLSLSRERDPVMFYEGLAQLGRRLEADGREEVAREIYTVLVAARPQEGEVPANVRTLAQERLEVLNGGGSFGRQAERFLRRAPEETFHSSMFFGLVPTLLVGKSLRLASLSWLRRNPIAGFLTRGLGSAWAAGFLGVAGEAAVLPVATRLGDLALGKELSWEAEQLGKEAWGSLLFLSGLRLATGSLSGVRQLIGAKGPLAVGIQGWMQSGLVSQAFLIGGVGLGQELEVWGGVREAREGAGKFFDLMSGYGQILGAGILVNGLLGTRLARWEAAEARVGEAGRSPTESLLPRKRGRMRPLWAKVAEGRGSGEMRHTLVRMQDSNDGSNQGGGSARPRRRSTLIGVGAAGPPLPHSPRGPVKETTSQNPSDPPKDALEVPRLPSDPAVPERASTLLDLRAVGRGSSPNLPFSTPPLGQVYNYNISGMDPGTPTTRIQVISAGDLVSRTEEHIRAILPAKISGNIRSRIFELANDLDGLQQEAIRGVVEKVMDELKVPEGIKVALALPLLKFAILFYRRGERVYHMNVSIEVNLQSRSEASTAPPPLSPGAETVRPRPSRSPHERFSSESGGPRMDTTICRNFLEVKDALARLLEAKVEERGLASRLRLQEGRLDQTSLRRLAPLLLDHPLNERGKITISWEEEGGGSLVFYREGDRISAELSYRKGSAKENFLIFSLDHRLHHPIVVSTSQLSEFSYSNWNIYEAIALRDLKRLADLYPQGDALISMSEEDSARSRGLALAALLIRSLPEETLTLAQLDSNDRTAVLGVQDFLERAYAFLDFPTLAHFQNRLEMEQIEQFQEMLGLFNENLLQTGGRLPEDRSAKPRLLLKEMPTEIPAYDWVPQPAHLRNIFLKELFAGSRGKRSPRETVALFADPTRLGKFVALAFRSSFSGLLTDFSRYAILAPEEDLESFLTTERSGRTSMAEEARVQMLGYFQDLKEFARLLPGAGPVHRQFLNAVFNGEGGIDASYRRIHEEWVLLPEGLRKRLGNPALPPADSLQAVLRGKPGQRT